MSPDATPIRCLWFALLVFISAALSACGQTETPVPPKPPDSPIGHFEANIYRYDGKQPKPDGTTEERLTTTNSVTIEVRADHTFRYDWKSLIEPGAKDGYLEGTWRSDPDSKHWLFRQAADVGSERSVSFMQGEMLRPGEAPTGQNSVPGQWAFPMPDTAADKLTDTYMFILRPAK